MKDPAALLYIDSWRTSTTEMDAITRAYYMDLLLHQYDKGSLPNNIEELANICRVRFSEFEQFKQVFEQVLKQKFKENENGRLENDFASEIIRKRQSFVEKRSNAGKLSYVLKYFRKNYKINKGLENFIKDNIDLDFDIKNEQVLKQVFEQISELYINGDEDENKDINKSKFNLETRKQKFQNEIEKKEKLKKKNWKNDYDLYLQDARAGYFNILHDKEFLKSLEDAYPNMDILHSIKNSFTLYWATDDGWNKKKKTKVTEINWKSTIRNGIKLNAVYKNKELQNTQPQEVKYEPSKQYKYL